MVFDIAIDAKNLKGTKTYDRLSVQVIARRDQNFLMLKSNRGDLIFPGGTVEKGESLKAAIIRETKEETGYDVVGKPQYVGKATVRKQDGLYPDCIYEKKIHFFECRLSESKGETHLTKREQALDLETIWLDKPSIIESNQRYLKQLKAEDVWMAMVNKILEYYD